MAHLLNWLWQGCVVALAAFALLRLLERSRAQGRYALCGVALLAVLVLPLVSLLWAGPSSAGPVLDASPPVAPMISVPSAWWTSTASVVVLFGLWSGVYGIRLAGALLAVRRARAGCLPFPLALESRLRCWNQVSSWGRRTRLVLSHDVRSAAVLGCGSPMIALAPALLQHLSVDELDRVVIHEWAHIRRRDDLMDVARVASRAIAGWHPAAWWLDRQLRVEREAACDEIAVAVTGCPKSYAACLTKVATLFPLRPEPLPALGALSSTLSTRVVRILSQRHLVSRTWSMSAVLVAVALLGAVFLALAGRRLIEPAASPSQVGATRAVTVQATAPNASAAVASRVRQSRPDAQRAEARIPKGSSAGPRPERAARVDPPAVPPQRQEPSAPAGAVLAGSVPLNSISLPVTRVPSSPSVLHSSPDTRSISPWTAAADAGVAIGRTSQKAGVATASFFSRFGKRIAGSF